MVKHIHRISKDDTSKKQKDQDLSKYEEWKFLPGMEPRPESIDPMLAKERTITFSNKFKNSTNEEIVKEKSVELIDQAANIDQYLRLANGVIKEKISKLKEMQDKEKALSNQVGFLQKTKTRKDLDDVNPKYVTEDDARALIAYLEEEYERVKDKLLYQELIVQRTKDEITKKRQEIDVIKEKIKKMLQNNMFQRQRRQEKILDPVAVLKEELRKAGVDERNKIYQMIDDLAEILNMRDLKDTIQKG